MDGELTGNDLLLPAGFFDQLLGQASRFAIGNIQPVT